MSKKRRRKKMKPYQVKLRVIGVLSLVVSMLVLWLPVPSKAAMTGAAATTWQTEYKDSKEVPDATDPDHNDNYINLGKFHSENPIYTSHGTQTSMKNETTVDIPDEAVVFYQAGNNYSCIPRIGTGDVDSDVFSGSNTLKTIDLSNVRFDESVSFSGLFKDCTALETVVFPASANTTGVKNVKDMFRNDAALKELDLSMLDLSGIAAAADAEGMLEGCDNLVKIETPVNVPDGVSIKLPHAYQDANVLEKAYIALPTETQVNPDISVTLIPAVEKIEVDLAEKYILTNNTFHLVVTVSPVVEGNKTVRITMNPSDSSKIEFPVGEYFTVGDDGRAEVPIKGIGNGDAPVKVTIQGVDESGNATALTATCNVKVRNTLVPVTGVSISTTKDTVDINDTLQLSPEFTPTTATDQGVKWVVSDTNLAEVIIDGSGKPVFTPTGNGVGTVRVHVITNDGGKQAYKDITITSTKEFKGIVDNRKDTSNGTETKGSVSKSATKDDWYLHIDSLDSNKTGDKAVMDDISTLLSGEGDFDKTSYFVVSKHKANPKSEGITNLNDDFGTALIRMPLPGDMLAVSNHPSKRLELYAYDGTGLTPVELARDSLGNNNGIGAVRYAVDTDDSKLAVAYVLAMDTAATVTPANYLYKVADQDTHAAPAPTSTVPTKAKENQTTDWFLVVKSLVPPTTVLSKIVDENNTLKAYDEKRYYDIYITDKKDLNKPDGTIDFGSVTITLPLPDGVAWEDYDWWFVSEHDGKLEESMEATLVQDTETGVVGVQFTATKFSEKAILGKLKIKYDIVTTHTGGGTAETTKIVPGTGITAGTPGTGQDAVATAVAGTPVTVYPVSPSDSGYHFVRWVEVNGSTETEVSKEALYTFTPTGNRTLKAVFEADSTTATPTPTPTPGGMYRVTIDRSPTGGGDVRTDKDLYADGDKAQLTATPAAGFSFVRWEDATTNTELSSLNPYTELVMNGNKHVRAVFVQEGTVAGEVRTIEANLNISIPEIPVNVSDINANINLAIPDINVNMNNAGAVSTAGAYATYVPVRIGNSGDMPKTGIGDIYRMIVAMLLVLSGAVEILLSIPAKKRAPVRRQMG